MYERFRVDGLKRYVNDDRFRVDGDRNMRLLSFAFTIVFVWTWPNYETPICKGRKTDILVHEYNFSLFFLEFIFLKLLFAFIILTIFLKGFIKSGRHKTPKCCLTFSPINLEEMKVLSFSRAVNQVIMRVHKPKVEYKLALQEKPQGSTLTYYYKTNNLTSIN